ncbi:MAG TPA: hypothetical protein VN327_13890 [Pseudonocardiaceae bacterium]|nr:hypothetical protein [Pseudonocardiaceae bacterium]
MTTVTAAAARLDLHRLTPRRRKHLSALLISSGELIRDRSSI